MSRLCTEALVVRTIEYGESDLIVTFLTEAAGKIGALVRAGRKSSKRVGGALEPFHTVEATLEDGRGELATLREARILRMRPTIVGDLDAMEAAGTGLRWARHLFPARTREPEGYAVITELLDRLDKADAPPRTELAVAAFRLLAAMGYALEFERCVGCSKPCPEGRLSEIDALRGGLVCRACGGGAHLLDAATRDAGKSFQRGGRPVLDPTQADSLLRLADDAMAVHAGFDR